MDEELVYSWLKVPSLNEAIQTRRPVAKGPSRLERKVAAKPLKTVTDAQFKKAVRERDKMRCKRCGRKVKITMERDPLRAEVHHLHGRLGVLRHEDRCAILVCGSCHEKLSGRVNERYIVVGTKFIEIEGQQRIDARAKVVFQRVA